MLRHTPFFKVHYHHEERTVCVLWCRDILHIGVVFIYAHWALSPDDLHHGYGFQVSSDHILLFTIHPLLSEHLVCNCWINERSGSKVQGLLPPFVNFGGTVWMQQALAHQESVSPMATIGTQHAVTPIMSATSP